MTVQERTSRHSRPPREPRVSLCADDARLIEVVTPADLSAEALRGAAADARGVCRLSREPARVLLDVSNSERADGGLVKSVRRLVREVSPGAQRMAVVLPRLRDRLAARAMLLPARRVRVFADRARAIRWLGRGG